jgi:RHS repeat-associated protein
VLWVGGDGSVLPYTKVSDSVWVAPNPSRPDTLKRVGSGFMRFLPGGVRVAFDERGRDTATIDRLGHRTRFHYRADDLLGSVILPLPADADTTARYVLSYADGRLQRVDAPGPVVGSVRTTTLHRTGVRVDSITDPDGTLVGFGYADSSARVASRTDRVGTITDFRYDAGGKLSGSTVEMQDTGDDIVTTLQVQESVGLADTLGSGAGAVDASLSYTLLDGPRTDVVDTTHFWLDRFGAPREIHDALGHVTVLARNDSLFPALVTRVEYPATEAGQRVDSATYTARGNLATSVQVNPYGDGQNAVTTYSYGDPSWPDFVTRIVQPEGEITDLDYEAATGNRLWQQAGPDSTRVHFHYTTAGLVDQTWVHAHPGDVRSFEYDSTFNDLSAEVTPLGIRHETGIDRIGRVTSQRLRYAPPGRIVQEDTMVYDLADRVVHSESFGPAYAVDPDSQRVVVDYGYDDSGRLRSVSRRSAPDTVLVGTIATSYGYDAAGRKTSETPPGSPTISTKYDAAGNPTRVITSRGDTITMGYGALNRLRWRVVPATRDFPLHATIADSGTVLASWAFPEPSLVTTADSSLTTPRDSVLFDYDATGNLTQADNAAAQIRRAYYRNGLLRYDTLRIHTWADSAQGGSFLHEYVLTSQYDLNGRRIELGHPAGVAPRNGTTNQVYATESYDYDPQTGALFHVTDVLGNPFTLSYDAYGRSSSMLAPGGTEVDRGYDADGNLTSLTASSPNYRGTGSSGAIFSFALSPNARGQIEYVSGTEHPSFTYSTLGHLKRYSSGASSQGGEIDTYETDALGHRGDVTEKGLETVTSYLVGTDRIDTTVPLPSEFISNAPSSSNVYDAAGSVIFFLKSSSVGTSPTDPSQGTRNLEQTRNFYDAEEHLVASDRKICVLVITAWITASQTATCKGPGVLDDSNANVFEWYRYDALGRRVLVRTRRDQNCNTAACASSITRNVWDGDDLLYEIRAPGGNVSTATLEDDHASGDNYGGIAYTHGLGIDQPLDLIRSGYLDDFGVEYDMQHWGGPFAIVPLADWRGGYRAGTMANGHSTPCGPGEGCEMLSWPAENYTSFWEDREPVSRKNWFGSLVLASKDGSGLMYRRNRYYNPTTGQFTQQDPIGLAGGLNLYGFGNGDPVGYSDPFGLSPACKGLWDCVKEFAAYEWRGFQAGADPTRRSVDFEQEGQFGAILGRASLAAMGAGRIGGAGGLATEEMSGMLRAAVRGKGNFGIGSATRVEADVIGRAWVGEGATLASDGKTLVSQNGLRQYRPPAYKPRLGYEQANLEWRLRTEGKWQGNAHIDIQ